MMSATSRTPDLTLLVAGDPDQLTGSYVYDARIVEALRERDWTIEVEGLAGRFPDARSAGKRESRKHP